MRESFRYLFAGASLLIVAGCSDSATMPSEPQAPRLSASAPAFDFSGGGQRSFGATTDNFSLGSHGGTFSVGGLYTLTFPDGSVCDPDRTSYGAAYWNSPCVALGNGKPIKVTATIQLTANGLAVDFSPELRFAPDKQVTISTDVFASMLKTNRAYFSAHPSALRGLAMYYTPSLGSKGVADYITDATLVTHIDLSTGKVWRRIKHFSGYSLATGNSCDPSPGDPDCIQVDGDSR